MVRHANNRLLQAAQRNKRDEFFTLYADVQRELQHYPDAFRGKVVYCNCDDPDTSQFVRYFQDHFQALGLRQLIASCYAAALHTTGSTSPLGRAVSYEHIGGQPVFRQLPLEGDGDFRSPACVRMLEQADVVVTNPPFSLFRDFIRLLAAHNKQFLVIGNVNAITYKEVFQLIQENRAWLGVNLGRGISGFVVPEHYDAYGSEIHTNAAGQRIIATNNCLWLTNLDVNYRHERLRLTRTYAGHERDYPTYDNCDGIHVKRTQDIPLDYPGLMGVPITFLHKFNPDQFELVRFRKGEDGKDLRIAGKCPYFRILIRHKVG